MINILLGFANEKILVIVEGNRVSFSSTQFGIQKTTIDGLKLDKRGVIREFPDLEGDDAWRLKAIGRFKEKISSFNSEKAIADYVIEDLKKFGYIPEQIQREGFRPEIIR